MSKIRESANGAECLVRIPGHCNFNPETTVHAHLNGGGMSMKHKDILGARACSGCHDLIDGRSKSKEYDEFDIKFMFYEGVFRTQEQLIKEGLIIES